MSVGIASNFIKGSSLGCVAGIIASAVVIKISESRQIKQTHMKAELVVSAILNAGNIMILHHGIRKFPEIVVYLSMPMSTIALCAAGLTFVPLTLLYIYKLALNKFFGYSGIPY